MYRLFPAFAVFFLLLFACVNQQQQQQENATAAPEDSAPPPETEAVAPEPETPERAPVSDTLAPSKMEYEIKTNSPMSTGQGQGAPSASSLPGLAGSAADRAGFVDMQRFDPSIRQEIRYATTDNFTNSKIYDCPRCLLRPEVAQALARAQRILQRQGLGLKVFDCYRPRPYQQRLWDKAPNPDYVTPPEQGSMHSRGAAVDLTLVDAQGNELDMGTPYDFFGREAHYTYTALPGQVQANRRLLRRTMEDVGLQGIRTEWWHFSYNRKSFSFSDWVWPCDQ